MYVGNDLIESVSINQADLRVPGYLGRFKRSLKVKYDELLRATVEQPEFLVFNPDFKPEQVPGSDNPSK